MMITESHYKFWHAIPFMGMEIEPSESMDLIFEDATVISRAEWESLPAKLRLRSGIQDTETDKLVRHTASDVRAGGWILVGVYAEKQEKWATNRARVIAAALNIVMLLMTRRKNNILIIGDMYSFPYMSTVSLNAEGRWSNSTKHAVSTPAWIIRPENRHTYTRTSLSELLNRENLTPLTHILTQPGKHYPDHKLRHILCRAALHLYWSHDSKTSEGQLVGAITAIEMVLRSTASESTSSYSQIEGRVITLLSTENSKDRRSAIEHTEDVSLFSLRHGTVHHGKEITKSMADKAIKLAIDVLFSFAAFSQSFDTPAEAIAFLDLMRQMEHITPKALNEMLAHWTKVSPQRGAVDTLAPCLVNVFLGPPDPNTIGSKHTYESNFSLAVRIYSRVRKVGLCESLRICRAAALRDPGVASVGEVAQHCRARKDSDQEVREDAARFADGARV